MALPLSFLFSIALAVLCVLPGAVTTSKNRINRHITPLIEQGELVRAREEIFVEHENIPDSYAGWLTANATLGNHLFFWFFPAIELNSREGEMKNPPLLLWLNGGPGVSSMTGLFWENGPLQVTNCPEELRDKPFCLRNITWAQNYSIIYVDTPVGVGYSYSDSGKGGYRNNREDYTEDMFAFLVQFFTLFSEYSSEDENEFFIGGQSFGSRYATALALKVHEERSKMKIVVPLKGIYLGGPVLDFENQAGPLYEQLYGIGALSYADKVNITRFVNRRIKLLKRAGSNDSDDSNQRLFLEALSISVPVSSFDNFVSGEYVNDAAINNAMRSSLITTLLNAKVPHTYAVFSTSIYLKLLTSIANPMGGDLGSLLDAKEQYQVLAYNGNFDVITSVRSVDAMLRNTPWRGQAFYKKSKMTVWKENANATQIKGWYTRIRNLCRVVIRGAGHQTPHDQPEIAMDMMNDFIQQGCVGHS